MSPCPISRWRTTTTFSWPPPRPFTSTTRTAFSTCSTAPSAAPIPISSSRARFRSAGSAPMSLLLAGHREPAVGAVVRARHAKFGRAQVQHQFQRQTAPTWAAKSTSWTPITRPAICRSACNTATASLTLTSNRINIKKFQGTVGGGTVSASGGVAYRPSIQFDLGLAAKGIRMLYPQGMREASTPISRFAGTTDNANLGGTVDLTDLSFTPAFELTSFVGQFSGVAAPPSRGFTQNVNLNLAVHSTNNVNLVSRDVEHQRLGQSAGAGHGGRPGDPGARASSTAAMSS